MNDQIERAIYETRAFLESRPAPDVTDAVMSRISNVESSEPAPRAGLLQRLFGMVWTPRQISIRPAYAIVGFAAVALLFLTAPSLRQPPGFASQAANGSEPEVFVQFRLETAAMRVQLAGSFTNWEPRYELRESAPGVWTITVPLTQGVHDYAFVVDGQQWVPDPYAPQIGDGFGGTNSRLSLLSPDSPQL